MTTVTQPNLERVREMIRRFSNGHDPDLAAEYFTDDFRWHGGTVGSYVGATAFAGAMRGMWTALPDVQASEQDALSDGDRVTMRFVIAGTHLGDLWGVAPTGRRVEWDATMTYRLVDGKIAEQWATEDWLAVLIAIGRFTPPWVDQHAATGRST